MIGSGHLSLLILPCILGMGPVADVTETELANLQPLQPLDARVEDVSLLATSLRVESPGLALPSDFDEVYRVPGDPSKLMRVNGALYAVFNQSVYGNYKGQPYATVPPATVFHIGAPPSGPVATSPIEAPSTGDPEPRRQGGYGMVASVGPHSHVGFSPQEELVEENLPRFIRDKSYRERRLAEIVDRRLNPTDDQQP